STLPARSAPGTGCLGLRSSIVYQHAVVGEGGLGNVLELEHVGGSEPGVEGRLHGAFLPAPAHTCLRPGAGTARIRPSRVPQFPAVPRYSTQPDPDDLTQWSDYART